MFFNLQRIPLDPARRSRLRRIILAPSVVAAIVLALQYTSHALLPAAKTDTMWGVLTGLVFGGIIIDRMFARSGTVGSGGVDPLA